MKKIIIIAVGILVVLAVLSAFKDLLIKSAVEKGVELVTGLRLEVGAFRVGVFKNIISIKNLILFNPPVFKDRTMLDMPEIYVDYDMASFLGGKVHLREIRVHLKELVVVKNETGELNLNSLNVVKAQKEKIPPAEKTQAAAGAPQIQIDSLRLKIGKAVYKDYSGGGEPSVKEFAVNIDEIYTDIRDPYSLVSLIVVRSLSKTAISNLANFDINSLKGAIADTLSSATDAAAKAVGISGETVKNATGVVKDTQEAVKKTAKVLEGVLKNPFGR